MMSEWGVQFTFCWLVTPTFSPGSSPSTLHWHCPAPMQPLLVAIFVIMPFDTYETHHFMSNEHFIIHNP